MGLGHIFPEVQGDPFLVAFGRDRFGRDAIGADAVRPGLSGDVLASAMIPALAAAYTIGVRASERRAAADAMVMMLPLPRRFIPGRKHLSVRKVADKFPSIVACHPSSGMSSSGAGTVRLPPALAAGDQSDFSVESAVLGGFDIHLRCWLFA